MQGTLEIIPVEIHNSVDGNELVKGLRYCIQFEAEKDDVLSQKELNLIRDTAKEQHLEEGYYSFDFDGYTTVFNKTKKIEI